MRIVVRISPPASRASTDTVGAGDSGRAGGDPPRLEAMISATRTPDQQLAVDLATDAGRLRSDEARPAFAEIAGDEDMGGHVTPGVAIDRHIGGAGVVAAGLDPADPVLGA